MHTGTGTEQKCDEFFYFIGATESAEEWLIGLETLNFNLVELCGSGYVSEHCISAFLKRQDDKYYRIYVTDALKCISENTAKQVGGVSMSKRFFEIIDRQKPQDVDDEKTAEEIIDKIKNTLKSLG